MSSPATRLLKRVRILTQHAETIAKAGRTIEKEITASHLLGQPLDERRVEGRVKAIEKRALQMARTIGIHHGYLSGHPDPDEPTRTTDRTDHR